MAGGKGNSKPQETLKVRREGEVFAPAADTVTQTLREMAGLCADGSIIAQDFYSKAFISGETSRPGLLIDVGSEID